MKLNKWNFFINPLIHALTLTKLCEFRDFIPEIKWKDLSYVTLHKFAADLGIFSKSLQRDTSHKSKGILFEVRLVESIMTWALEHPQMNSAKIVEVMNKYVCLCYFPSQYLNVVLNPYILKIISGKGMIYRCPVHKWNVEFKENPDIGACDLESYIGIDCYLSPLTPTICMMADDSFDIGRVRVYFEPTKTSGYLFSLDVDRQPKLILFNRHQQLMKKYPVLSTYSIMDLDKLREIVATYQNLRVMFFVDQ